MTAWLVVMTAALVVVLMASQERASPAVSRIVKMAASTGLIAVALSAGAVTNAYGRFVLAALVLSWLGDLLLTFDTRRAFVAGLVSFLAAHITYTAGFATRGVEVVWLLGAGIALAAIALWVWRRLLPNIDRALRGPVAIYIAVITSMVTAAVATTAASPDPRILLGALAFYLSDLAVARNRFVAPAAINQMVGRPLYFGGQVLLALSSAG